MLPTELTDMELDAVCGGFLNFNNPVTQINTGLNIAVPVVFGSGGLSNVANITQQLEQANFSII